MEEENGSDKPIEEVPVDDAPVENEEETKEKPDSDQDDGPEDAPDQDAEDDKKVRFTLILFLMLQASKNIRSLLSDFPMFLVKAVLYIFACNTLL